MIYYDKLLVVSFFFFFFSFFGYVESLEDGVEKPMEMNENMNEKMLWIRIIYMLFDRPRMY